MTRAAPSTGAAEAFRDRLVENGLLIETGVRGVFGKGAIFEDVIERFDDYVTRMGEADSPEVVRFPPLLNRSYLAKSGYLGSFPQLAGTVHSFDSDSKAHNELLRNLDAGHEWAAGLPPTELSLTPAACYPVYGSVKGPLPEGGRLFDVMSYCFRHEPSSDPARMQVFRMHEYVRLGEPAEVKTFRDDWLERGRAMLAELGIPIKTDIANDPFFGRRGQMLAATQREQALKFELLASCAPGGAPSAIASCNYHLDHLAHAFGIYTPDGDVAHTACVGFGLERVALALFSAHGLETSEWPTQVRETLCFPQL